MVSELKNLHLSNWSDEDEENIELDLGDDSEEEELYGEEENPEEEIL